MKEWIVIATREKIKIFEKRQQFLFWVQTIRNKKGRRKEAEFHRDRAGLSYTNMSSKKHAHSVHSLDPRELHKEIICAKFIHRTALFLKQAFNHKKYVKLTLVAEPHLLGKLRAQVDNAVKGADVHTITKGLGLATTEEIQAHLFLG